MSSKITDQKPRGLLRWFLRMPVLLYRLHLGWLLDGRFLMLTHIGRYSKLSRQVVLEVVNHDKESGAYFVAAGWRGHADWFLNIKANPTVYINIGKKNFKAIAEITPYVESAARFYRYAQEHPLAFQELTRLMMNERLHATQEDCLHLAESVPLVRLMPTQAETGVDL